MNCREKSLNANGKTSHITDHDTYSNYHADIDENGYYKDIPLYYELLYQTIKDIKEVPVVHCTYFIHRDLLSDSTGINYKDKTNDYEYVIFSRNARKNSIKQYLDTRKLYGYLTFAETTEQFDQVKHIIDWI